MTEVKKAAPMHKLACALLALVMAIGICVPSMASAAAAGTYTITVSPAYGGETYTAYKVFDATYTGSSQEGDLKVSYTIEGDSPWFAQVSADTSAFTVEQIGSTNTYTVTLKEFTTDDEAKQAIIATLSSVPEGAVEADSVTAGGNHRSRDDGCSGRVR